MTTSTSRAILRLARRDIGRSRWRSSLVALLVLLPVAGMVGAATVMLTVTPSPERTTIHRQGQADLVLYPSVGAPTTTAFRALLPEGSAVEAISSTEGRLLLPGMELRVNRRSLDLEGLAAGMLTIVAGRGPASGAEVAISATLAAATKSGVGGSIEIADEGTRTVVGIVEDPFNLRTMLLLEDPSVALRAADSGQGWWLVSIPPGFDIGNVDGIGSTIGRSAFFAADEDTTSPTILVLGGLALVEAALVASAAFALNIRRRQRELGLLAATGAEPRHLAGTVVATAALLGGAGAAIGVVVGLAGALAASPWLDQLTDRRNPPVTPSLGVVGVAAAIGLLAALIAGLVPAWSAGRLPVLTALSGRRPAPSSARRTLLAGLALVVAGVALTAAGSVSQRQGGGSVSLLGMLLGAVVATLGFGACSPWLLERLERPAARLPLAGRIALRDTARARSRNGPIVAALLASFAATVALAAYLASVDASVAREWQPWLRPDQVLLVGDGVELAGPEVARELRAVAAAPLLGAGNDERFVWLAPGDGDDPNVGYYGITIGDAELLRAVGAETAAADLEAGSVVLLMPEELEVDHVTLHVTNVEGEAIERSVVPARVVVNGLVPGELPQAILPRSVADQLGLVDGRNDRFVVRLDHTVTDADLERAAAIAAQSPNTAAQASRGPDRRGEGFRLFVLIGSLLFALSVTGIAVALGEAESRPDQRTMLAVGADPRVRRRIAAARAAVISALAGVLAVPAGLLPAWGLLVTRDAPLVVPVAEIAVALVGLPLLATAGTYLLSRPLPTWGSFRAAGS